MWIKTLESEGSQGEAYQLVGVHLSGYHVEVVVVVLVVTRGFSGYGIRPPPFITSVIAATVPGMVLLRRLVQTDGIVG